MAGEPLSPPGAREEVLDDPVLGVWNGGLMSVDIAAGFDRRTASERQCGPFSRIDVEHFGLRVKDCYKIARAFGSGGFAVVRHGVHDRSKEEVCVKVVNKEKAGKSYRKYIVEGGMYEALLRMSNGHFQHHNIVRYWDFFESPTKYYVVMEKLKGCELSVALTENGAKWSERQCAGVMRDLLSALQFLHEVAGMYHRDVKLENLMFRGRTSGPMAGRKVDGGLVLLDFGLARFVGQKWDGMYGGTERYAAPEVVAKTDPESGGFSPAVDLWAAGVILCVLLTGAFPFQKQDVKSLEAAPRAREAIARFVEKRAQEGRTVPRKLLEGLLHEDPAERLNASRALDDEWLELAPELPAAENYAVVAMKSPDTSFLNRKASLEKSTTSTSTRASPTTAVSSAGRGTPPSNATSTTKQQQEEEQQTLMTQHAFSLQDHKPGAKFGSVQMLPSKDRKSPQTSPQISPIEDLSTTASTPNLQVPKHALNPFSRYPTIIDF
jgi:serine/threonine protein kinase